MRILQVPWRIDEESGGGPAAAVHLSRALTEEGIHVTLASTRPPDAHSDPLPVELRGVEGLLFKRSRVVPYSYSHSLCSWLAQHIGDYDLVEIHAVFNHPSWVTAQLAARAGIPYLIHPHGSLDPYDLRKHRLLKRLLGPSVVRSMLANASGLVTTSALEAERLETFGARVSVRTLFPPYRVERHEADASKFRQTHSLEDDRVILFLGRLDPKKGLVHLLRATESLRVTYRNAVVVVGGDDSSRYAVRLKSEAAKINSTSMIRFLGHMDAFTKSSALASADLLVLLSDNENFGLVLLEAAWWGVPMIISSEVYICRLLESAGAAVVIQRNARSLAEAITQLLCDPAKRREMSEGGRALANSEFDWRRCAMAHARLRRELLRI